MSRLQDMPNSEIHLHITINDCVRWGLKDMLKALSGDENADEIASDIRTAMRYVDDYDERLEDELKRRRSIDDKGNRNQVNAAHAQDMASEQEGI